MLNSSKETVSEVTQARNNIVLKQTDTHYVQIYTQTFNSSQTQSECTQGHIYYTDIPFHLGPHRSLQSR